MSAHRTDDSRVGCFSVPSAVRKPRDRLFRRCRRASLSLNPFLLLSRTASLPVFSPRSFSFLPSYMQAAAIAASAMLGKLARGCVIHTSGFSGEDSDSTAMISSAPQRAISMNGAIVHRIPQPVGACPSAHRRRGPRSSRASLAGFFARPSGSGEVSRTLIWLGYLSLFASVPRLAVRLSFSVVPTHHEPRARSFFDNPPRGYPSESANLED